MTLLYCATGKQPITSPESNDHGELLAASNYLFMSNLLGGKKVVVVGGSSGMGFAVAKLSHEAGATVVLASRSKDKLLAKAKELGNDVQVQELDTTREESIKSAFANVGKIDHLVIPGSSTKTGPLKSLSVADAEFTMRSKFFGPYLCAKYAELDPEGSLTLFSGVLSQRPGTGMPILGAVNAAVEGLGRALALELAPVRVNVVSPGMTRDTGAYLSMPEEAREGMFKLVADHLPVKRVGTPHDLASISLALMTNPFITGVIVPVDGGGLLV